MLPENFRYVELEPYVRHTGTHVRIFQVQEWCADAQDYYPVLTPGRWVFQIISNDGTPADDSKVAVPYQMLCDLKNRRKAVMICKGEHGVRYFSANTTEEIGKAAVKLVLERDDAGYYCFASEPTKPTRHAEDFVDDPELAKTIKRQWARYGEDLRAFKESQHNAKLLEGVVSNNNYFNAFRLLGNGDEYESFRIKELENVE